MLRPETLQTGAANIFPAMPTSPSRAVPQPCRAAPPPSTPQSEASTPVPRPLFLHTLQYFLSLNLSRLSLSDHRDFGAVKLLSPDPPDPSVTPDPLLQPALTVQIMFQIHPRSHLEAKQSNFRSAPEVTEREGSRRAPTRPGALPPSRGELSALTRRTSALTRRTSGLSTGPAELPSPGADTGPRRVGRVRGRRWWPPRPRAPFCVLAQTSIPSRTGTCGRESKETCLFGLSVHRESVSAAGECESAPLAECEAGDQSRCLLPRR